MKNCLLFIMIFVIIISMNSSASAKIWIYKQVTNNDTDDRSPDIDRGKIVWRGMNENGKLSLLLYDIQTEEITDIISGEITGQHIGPPSLSGGQVAFRGYDWVNGLQVIYLWDGTSINVIDERPWGNFPGFWGYPPSYGSLEPSLDNGKIAYAGWDGSDYEIYFWNGNEVIQITDNLTDDYEAQLDNGKISWTGWSDETNSVDVFYWDGYIARNVSNDQNICEDSDTADGKVVFYCISMETDHNADIVLWNGDVGSFIYHSPGADYEPEIHGAHITWTGWPNGKGGDAAAVSFVWDGYKTFNLLKSPYHVWGSRAEGSKFVFEAWDGNDWEIILADYITGTYKPEVPYGRTRNLVVDNNIAYVANGSGDLKIVDVSNLFYPVEIGQYYQNDGWEVFGVAKKDNIVFVANRGAGIKVIDVSTPDAPVLLATIETKDFATTITLDGDFLYVGDRLGGFYILDVSSPSTPSVTKVINLEDSTYGIEIQGDLAYVANYHAGFRIVDISTPEDPQIISTFDLDVPVWDVTLKDNYAYLVCPGFGIKVLDISEPYDPVLIGECEFPDGSDPDNFIPPFAITINGNHAFVTNGNQGVLVIDIFMPNQPCIVERIDTPGYAWGLSLQGRYMLVADGLEGFHVIDVGDYISTTFEDAEDGSTDGWSVYDDDPPGGLITNVFDTNRQSKVIALSGSGKANGYRLRNGDGSKWHNDSQFVIEWSMRYSEDFTVYIDVETSDGPRFITYKPVENDGLGEGRYIYYGLGSGVIDGQWHTIVRDLQADLESAQSGVRITEVNGFWIRGSGAVDDIVLKTD